MLRNIFLMLVVGFMSAFSSPSEEKTMVQKVDDEYTITYFNHKAEVLAYFEKKGLQGGGYTWEALVEAALSLDSPQAASDIEFDSEGDAFFARTTSQSVVNAVKVVIKKLSSDLTYREKCINIAAENGTLE